MTEDSIDFGPLPEAAPAEPPVRKFFRVPVSDEENITARINGQTYSVANISVAGIAIHAESCLEFEAGQTLEEVVLWIGTERLRGLTGEVIHCSVHDGGYLRFGIQWQGMGAQDRAVLETAMGQLTARVLKSGPPKA